MSHIFAVHTVSTVEWRTAAGVSGIFEEKARTSRSFFRGGGGRGSSLRTVAGVPISE